MKKRLTSGLIWSACFALPLALYLWLWNLIGQDVSSRAGYIFWLMEGTEAQATMYRIDLFETVFSILPGVLLGIAAVGWRVVILHRRRKADPG